MFDINKYPEIASMVKDGKFIPLKADWQKTLNYYKKLSNPTKIVSSTKDLKKLISRYVISEVIGWDELSHEIYRSLMWECDGLINYIRTLKVDIPVDFLDAVKDVNDKRIDLVQIAPYEKIKTVLLKSKCKAIVRSRNSVKGELERMRTNGRAWNLAYSIDFYKHEDSFEDIFTFNFSCDTNEGIDEHPYGYSVDFGYTDLSQADVAKALEKFMLENDLM
jgi:hypothetical protein